MIYNIVACTITHNNVTNIIKVIVLYLSNSAIYTYKYEFIDVSIVTALFLELQV